MSRHIIAAILLLLSGTVLLGQNITFEATTQAKQVVQGSYFEVKFVLKNAQGQSFSAPDFEGFSVMSGPNRSSEVSIVNGRMSQQMSYGFTISPDNVGQLTIGSASIEADGKRYTSKPITIDVVKGKKRDAASANTISSKDIFVEAEVNYPTGYIGQQLTLSYVLYTTKNIGSYDFRSIPDFDGFYARGIQNWRDRPEVVVRDGIQYSRRTIRVYALYPQRKGAFTIEPLKVTLGVSTGKSSGSFFFNRNLKPIQVTTNAVDINIVDVQSDSAAPISYADAIGDFYMGSAIDKRKLPKDDALTLTYQIKGDGDGKIFKAPDQSYTDLFEIYDPNLLREETEYDGDREVTIKTYEYLMIPKKEGKIKFRPELSYYSPDSMRYMTILGETYTIEVTPPTGRQRKDVDQQRKEWPEIYTTTDIGKREHYLMGSPVHLGLLGVSGLSLLGLLGFYRKKVKEDAIDPALKRNAAAKKVAIAQLKEAKKALSAGDHKEFYIQLRKGLLEYLSSKTYQDSSQMSKDDIVALLQKNDLSAYESDIIDVMKKGEMAIYANMSSGDEQQMYDKIISIIENIETSLEK